MALLGLRAPVRSAETELFDTFFVSSIGTVLVIRIFLEATGYPQLGGNGLHIAHVLWGGLGMLAALVLLLGFISPTTRHLAALVGGAGFGAFIDELGKFVTSDNDYFFKPTAALIYVLFVVLFFVVRQIRRYRGLTPTENLVNAIALSERLATGGLTPSDRQRALELLAGADPSDPFVPVLRQRLLETSAERRSLSRADRVGRAIRARSIAIARSRWLRRLVIALFVLEGFGIVLGALAAVALLAGAAIGEPDARAALAEATGGATFTSWIQVAAGIIGGAMVIRGIVVLRRSRSGAYRSFEIAILLDLVLVQPFQFLDLGFGPAADVIADLVLLAILR